MGFLMLSIPGKIPIRIYPFFWFLIAIIGWTSSGGSLLHTAIWAVVILYSVLIHEYGHALTALAFGQEAHIELVGLGGVTHREGPKLKPWQEFIIILDGPLAGVLLLLVAYAILLFFGEKLSSTMLYALEITVYANIFWTVVNLLPIHPLDGGRLFSIILESLFGVRGLKIALFLSGIFAIAISILFFYTGIYLGGALFILLAFESYRAWKSSMAVSEKDQDDSLQELLKQAELDLHQGKETAGREKLDLIRETAGQGVIYNKATEYLAGVLINQGLFREAYALLTPIEKKLSPEALRLYHLAAYKSGSLKDAVVIGDKAYQNYPSYQVAIINAFCYGLLGEARPAIGWLQRAVTDGLPNVKAILTKQEFDNIRSTSPFQEFVQKHTW